MTRHTREDLLEAMGWGFMAGLTALADHARTLGLPPAALAALDAYAAARSRPVLARSDPLPEAAAGTRRRWTRAEVDELVRLRGGGATWGQIGRLLGRPRAQVAAYWSALKRKGAVPAGEAPPADHPTPA